MPGSNGSGSGYGAGEGDGVGVGVGSMLAWQFWLLTVSLERNVSGIAQSGGISYSIAASNISSLTCKWKAVQVREV